MTAPLMKVPDVQLERAKLMLDRARWATAKMQKLDVHAVRRISEAVARAGHAKAQHYADWAVRETGMGVPAHKKIKNEACSLGIFERYGHEDYTGLRIDPEKKMVELPRPAGVIFALIPVTNPVATVFFKTMLALMTRNAIILSPHPGAKACCADAARLLAQAAAEAGAPDGIIQVIEEPSIPLIESVMSDDRVDLIVATGGPSVVKAAYRSGNPAYGVGPGNAPVLVDDSADIKQAARRIVESKAFDNSILCTNESVVLAFTSIADALIRAMRAEGAHICSREETDKLRTLLFREGGFNTAMIGKDASHIAREAGFNAGQARILLAPIDLVQPEERLAREKLCPVLAFATVQTIDQALAAARSIMRKYGKGHSAAIHSRSEANILAFSASVPALRVAVNAGCSLGASGFETNLGPSMTIGTGFTGGSSIGDNLTPHHLVHYARIAYNKATGESFGQFDGLDALALPRRTPPALTLAADSSGDIELRRELRRIILEELNAVLAA